MDNNTMKGLPHVEATLNYLAEGTERPVSYAYTSPSDTPPTTRRNSPHPVTIRNARPILSCSTTWPAGSSPRDGR